jgi:hypothetical protein
VLSSPHTVSGDFIRSAGCLAGTKKWELINSVENKRIWLLTIIVCFRMDNEKLNILKLLIENQEESFSIRKISIKRNINYKSAYNAVRKLEKENVIELGKYGNTTLCRFNLNFNDSVFIVENARRQELLKNKSFKVMHSRFGSINHQFILILFGSHARKENTKYSDIDLLGNI